MCVAYQSLVSEVEAFLDDARNMLEAAQLQLIWWVEGDRDMNMVKERGG